MKAESSIASLNQFARHQRPSARMDLVLDRMRPWAHRISHAIFHAQEPRLAYIAYLEAMYLHMRASVPLMLEAAEAFRVRGEDTLAVYCQRHAGEESNHDAWLLDDIAASGGDPTRAAARLAPTQMGMAVGAQYYWIRHGDPRIFFGYVYPQESRPHRDAWIDALALRTGLSEDAFTCLRHHAAEDPAHAAELRDVIDSSIAPTLLGAVLTNMVRSLAAILDVFESEVGRGGKAR